MSSSGVRRRSWLAAAAVLGLVGSLLAVGVVAPPAGGAAGEADNEAQFSACVGPALVSQGLVDVVGSFSEDAVNCLGHYNVTKGRTETLYDPGAPVRRWQMALFLSRAAVPAGVVLPAAPADEFTDLGEASDETRAAVNQMADLGIMPGVSSTSFRPDVNVTRAQMALMLDAFLGKAQAGAGAFGGDVMDYPDDVNPDDEVFGDIGQVTRGEYPAIRRMFEVGVARGTSDGRFNPGGLVTRAQMAVFITRMLAHTAARPVGVTLQVSETAVTTADSVDLAVSVRGPDLMGVPDAKVDVFSAVEADDAFGEDGRCSSDAVLAVTHTTACEIVVGDESTDASGDYSTTVGPWADSLTVWGWSGEVGDRFDSDDVSASSVAITVTKPGVKLKVSDDMADNATAAKFGASVVFTVQVVDDDGEAVALEGVKFNVGVRESSLSGAEGASAVHNSYGRSYETDDDGMVEFTFRQTDPRSDSTGDAAWLDLDIGPGSKAGAAAPFAVDDKTTLKMAGVEAGNDQAAAAVVWLDTAASASVLKLAQTVEYHEASDTGNGAANTVTATLTDQYGDPVSRQAVEFASDDAAGIGAAASAADLTDLAGRVALQYYDASRLTHAPTEPNLNRAGGTIRSGVDSTRGLSGAALRPRTKTTNRQGVAALTYNRKSSATGIETITARVKAEKQNPLSEARTTDRHEDKWDIRSGDIVAAERIYHYWAEEPGKDGSAQGRLMVKDTDNNRLILVDGDAVSLVEYDSNDQFDATTGPALLADFEKDLEDNAAHASVIGYQTDSKKVSRIIASPEWGSLSSEDMAQRFGSSFAADNGVIVIGAPKYAYGATQGVGRVYVYEGAGDAEPAILEMPEADRATNARFGSLVDISGDTIVVSTRIAHLVPNTNGVAYVFVKPSGGWADSDAPTRRYQQGGGGFGQQVAVDRDRIVVGHARGFRVYERTGDPAAWPANNAGVNIDKGFNVTPRNHCVSNRCLDVVQGGITGTLGTYTNADRDVVIMADSLGRGTNPHDLPDARAQGMSGLVSMVFESAHADGWSRNGPPGIPGTKILPPSVNDVPEPGSESTAAAQNVASNARDARAAPESRWAQSVSISGKDDTLTVMISHEDVPQELFKRVMHPPNVGAVYIYTVPDYSVKHRVSGTVTDFTADYWYGNCQMPRGQDICGPRPLEFQPAAKLTVPVGAGYGAFGTHADLSDDGNTVVVSQHYAQQGDWLGKVHVFTKPAGGWEDSDAPDEQYVGPAANAQFGWGATIDDTTGAIWAGSSTSTVYMIDRTE